MLYTHGITTLLLADRGLNEIVSAVKGKCHDIVEFQEHTAWEKKYQYLLDMIPFRKFDLGETRQFVSYYKHVFSAMAIKAARDNRSLCLLTFPMPKVPQSINDKGLDMWLKEGFVGKMKGILRPIDIYFQYGNNIYIASHRMQELVGKIILKRFVHQLKPFVIENGKVVTVQTLRFFQENSVSVKDVSCIPSELVDMVSGFLEDKICLK